MKPVRGALFDLGSNSIKFMLGEQSDSTLTVCQEKAFVTRLAENLQATGRLSKPAMKRSLDVLKKCCADAHEFGASKIVAVGTSALRSAKNRRDFLQMVKKETGLSVRVISGKQEGALVFAGISSSKFWAGKAILAADIGGGSVEFITGKAGKISFTRSLPLGCVRVHDHYLKSQPVKPSVIDKSTVLLRDKMAATLEGHSKGRVLVVSGGTASALAWLQFPPAERPPLDELEGFEITLAALDKILLDLAPLSSSKIQKQFDLPPGRADIVVSGAVILRSILLQSGITKARFASRGLRYGLWLEAISTRPFRNVQWQPLPL